MKITSRVFSTFLLIIILAVTLITSLFLNLSTPSLQAGTEPTKAAYLPLIMQPTDPNVTPTATPNPEDFANILFDALPLEAPISKQLGQQQAHLHPISFDHTGAITITAVAEPNINLVLEIRDASNTLLHKANNGSSGELETLANTQLEPTQDYNIRVYDLSGQAGHYCLIFNEAGGFPDSIRGRIAYGQTETAALEVLGIDYWCFMGASGDNISLLVSPTGSSGDLVLALFRPPDLYPIGSPFVADQILNVDLTADGMYIIGILDFDAGTSEYTLTLNKN